MRKVPHLLNFLFWTDGNFPLTKEEERRMEQQKLRTNTRQSREIEERKRGRTRRR